MAVCGFEFPDGVLCGQVFDHDSPHVRWGDDPYRPPGRVCLTAPNYAEAQWYAVRVMGSRLARNFPGSEGLVYVSDERNLLGYRGGKLIVYEGSGDWRPRGEWIAAPEPDKPDKRVWSPGRRERLIHTALARGMEVAHA